MNDSKKLSKDSTVTAKLFAFILNMSNNDRQALLKELEEKTGQGKRAHNRKPLLIVVDYATQDGAYKDFIKNISAGGVFIETNMPFSAGQEVALTFPLPDHQEHIKIIGEVVRITSHGIGVKFKLSNDDQETMIKAILESV